MNKDVQHVTLGNLQPGENNEKNNPNGINGDEDEIIDLNAMNEDGLDQLEMLYEEQDYQNVQNQLKDFRKFRQEADNELEDEIDKYYNTLRFELNSLQEMDTKENENAGIMQLKFEKLVEDIERDHIQAEEYKEENVSIDELIKIEKNKNSSIDTVFLNAQITDKIYSTIAYVDLTTISKFRKFLIDSSDSKMIDSLPMLRGQGGDYLKRQAAVIYYLQLIKQRYLITKIVSDIGDNSDNIKLLLNSRQDVDKIRQFESKIKVIYNNDSFLINLETEEKKETYTFKDLKEEACDLFSIPKELRKSYHIVNDKLYVYSHRIKVWEIHKQALENNRSTLNWAHMELIDKLSIFMDRNANVNRDQNENRLNVDNDIEKPKNFNEINEQEIFKSEIEEYVILYRRIEAFKNLFKKDFEKLEIQKRYLKVLQHWQEERRKALRAVENDEDDEMTEKMVHNKYDEIEKTEKLKFDDEIWKHKKKPELPIYLSMMSIFYFRLGKFWYFLYSILFAVTFFIYINNTGSLDIKQTNSINRLLRSASIFNPLYKLFNRNQEAFKSQDFERMVKTRTDTLLWLDILFNNLVFKSDLDKTLSDDGIDYWNGFYQRLSTYYEILGGLRFTFKTSQPTESLNNKTLFKLPNNISNNLDYFREYQLDDEDTQRLNFTGSAYSYLSSLQDRVCKNCISTGYIEYDPVDSKSFISLNGDYGDYTGGSYSVFLNNNAMNRQAFDTLFVLLKKILFDNTQRRLFVISYNSLHIYYKALAKIQIIFEFSTIGDLKIGFTSDIIDTGNNTSSSFKLLNNIFTVQMALFTITLSFNLFTKYLVRKQVKSINSATNFMDILLLFMFILFNYYNSQSQTLNNQLIGNMLDLNPEDCNENLTYVSNPKAFTYTEFGELIDMNKKVSQTTGIISLLLFFRILFYMMASPLFYYMIILAVKVFKSVINVVVVLTIFIVSFSLLSHVTLGDSVQDFSNLSSSILVSLFSILGFLNTENYGSLTNVQYMIFIIFLVIIKLIFFTFIFAYIKEIFDYVKKEYRAYKRKDHFKFIGETVFLFFKYMLFPFSIYFMIKDFLKHKKIYGKVDLVKLVNEEEVYGKIV